jgi:uncharacterized LabA/DUF88 family protein
MCAVHAKSAEILWLSGSSASGRFPGFSVGSPHFGKWSRGRRDLTWLGNVVRKCFGARGRRTSVAEESPERIATAPIGGHEELPSAFFLVDYDNVSFAGRRPSAKEVARVCLSLMRADPLYDGDCIVRLYGGWYGPEGLTRRGEELVREIDADFPVRIPRSDKRCSHIKVELVSSLLALPGQVFDNTYRKVKGLPRIDLVEEGLANCQHSEDCAAKAVIKWSRAKKCPMGCPVHVADVFEISRQKLVDSILVCDILTLAADSVTFSVFVVSDDDDLVPAAVLARIRGMRLSLVRTKNRKVRYYEDILRQHGVTLLSWPSQKGEEV